MEEWGVRWWWQTCIHAFYSKIILFRFLFSGRLMLREKKKAERGNTSTEAFSLIRRVFVVLHSFSTCLIFGLWWRRIYSASVGCLAPSYCVILDMSHFLTQISLSQSIERRSCVLDPKLRYPRWPRSVVGASSYLVYGLYRVVVWVINALACWYGIVWACAEFADLGVVRLYLFWIYLFWKPLMFVFTSCSVYASVWSRCNSFVPYFVYLYLSSFMPRFRCTSCPIMLRFVHVSSWMCLMFVYASFRLCFSPIMLPFVYVSFRMYLTDTRKIDKINTRSD